MKKFKLAESILTSCITALILLVFQSHLQAQAPQHVWSGQINVPTGPTGTIPVDFKNDNSGNTYIVGKFKGTVDLNPGPAVVSVTGQGTLWSTYVVKLDKYGDYVWGQTFLSNSGAENFPTGMDVTPGGKVFLTGSFYSQMYSNSNLLLNGIQFPGCGNPSVNPNSQYMIILNPDMSLYTANLIQGRALASVPSCFTDFNNVTPHAATIDNAGNIIVTGQLSGGSLAPVDLDINTSATVNYLPGNYYIAKYDTNFNLISHKKLLFTTQNTFRIDQIETNANNIFIQGFCSQVSFDFNNGIAPVVNPTHNGNYFTAAYNSSSLNAIWAFKLNTNKQRISINPTGGLALGLETSLNPPYDIDPSAATFNLTGNLPGGYSIIYLAHYNESNGTLITSGNKAPGRVLDSIGNFGWCKLGDIGFNADGSYFVTGSVTADNNTNIVDFDPGIGVFPLAQTANIGVPNLDCFIAKYNANKTVNKAHIIRFNTSTSESMSNLLAIDANTLICSGLSILNGLQMDPLGFAPVINSGNFTASIYGKYIFGGTCGFTVSTTSPDTLEACKLGATVTTNSSQVPVTYQWYKNGVLEAGQTSATINTASPGTYQCLVRNGCSQAWSKKIVYQALASYTTNYAYPLDGNLTGTYISGNYPGTGVAISYGTDRGNTPNAAAVFNGTNSSVTMNGALINNNPGSVSLWFKRSNLNNQAMVLVSLQQTTPGSWNPILYIDNTGLLKGFAYIGCCSPMNTNTYVLDTAWHHVVWTYSGTVQQIYFDGVLKSTLTGTVQIGASDKIILGNGYLSTGYGGVAVSGNQPFAGKIDRVIFGSHLSKGNVTKLYNEPIFNLVDLGPFITTLKDVCSITNFTINGGVLTNPNPNNPVTYTWKHRNYNNSPYIETVLTNNASISGANTPTLVINNANPTTYTNAGFVLSITDSYCNTIQGLCFLNVITGAGTITQPTNTSACLGSNVIFVAKGSAATAYQWKKNGVNILNSNNDTLFINNVSAGDFTTYTCDITGCGGTIVTTNTVTLTQTPASITTQTTAFSNPTCIGTNNYIYVVAQNAASYQWKKGGVAILSSNNDTLFLPNIQASSAGSYTCEITGCSGGTLTSNTINITLTTPVLFNYNNLVADYLMNGNANNAVSATWNGATGTGTSLTTDRNSLANKAYSFDGSTNAKIDMGDITTINGATQLTIAGWFNAANLSTNNEFFGKTNASTQGIYARNFSSINYAYLNSSTYTTASAYTTLGIANNQWFHYAVTFNAGSYSCYINGVLQQTINSSSALANTAGFPFQLGENGTAITGSVNWNGKMDEVSIFTRQLVTSEILQLKDAPHFIQHPSNISACAGNTLTLTAVADDAAVSYQWRRNGVDIVGANASTYSKSNVSSGDAGTYTCVIIKGCNGAISLASTVTITSNSTNITSQPQSASKCVGQSASFTIAATGGTGFQWKKNGNPISGQTAATLSFTSVSIADAGTYTCEVLGGTCGVIESQSAVLTVNTTPSASVTPSTQTICAGQSVSLTAAGGGTYAWSNGGGSNAIASFSPTATTTYTVTVSAGSCSATASANITVNPLPNAAISPATVSICAGQTANLTASGGGSYVWSNGGGNNANASFTPSATSTYNVTVTLSGCSTTISRLVTVNALPNAAISATSDSVCLGTSTTLQASGGGTYLWNNGLGSAANQTVTPITNTSYNVTVTSNNCTATANKTIYVKALPNVSISGADIVCLNATVTLSASGATSYSWNGAAFSTQNTFTLANVGSQTTVNLVGKASNNCTKAVSKTVQVSNPANYVLNETICNGSTYSFAGSALTQSGTYFDTLQNALGCDSLVVLNLTVSSPITSNFSASICEGSSYSFNGQTFTLSGSYNDTLVSVVGCDSIVTLNLLVALPSNETLTTAACNSFTFNNQTYTQSGLYFDTLVNAAGCDSIITLDVTINVNPTPVIDVAGFNLSTQVFDSYQWYLNGNPIAGANAQTYTALANGIYTVEVADVNTCAGVSAGVNITTVSIRDFESNIAFKVFPNPTKDVLNIQVDGKTAVNAKVYNVNGQMLDAFSFTENYILNMETWSQGVYVVQFQDALGNTVNAKVIKE